MALFLLRGLSRLFVLLLLLFLLGSGAARAQTAAHRYWEADADSLRRVLTTQRGDSFVDFHR